MSLGPVIFVVGRSGAGKDDVCGWIKSQYNFEWINIDKQGNFETKRSIATDARNHE